MSSSSPSIVTLDNMLVLLICVGEYDSKALDPLPGTQNDKNRLYRLFNEIYGYKIICNQSPRVNEDDLEQILLNTKIEFKSKQQQYQGIMVFYSGHGDSTNLLLSDFKKESDGEITGIYCRSKFISYFNGNNVRTKARSYKLFYMDSCRGNQMAELFPYEAKEDGAVIGGKGGNDTWIHPETNRGVLYSNPNSYQSYEIVYDRHKDDIAWHRLTRELYMKNEKQPKCGIFMNAVYHVFKANAEENECNMNYGKIQDEIKKKAARKVPVYGDYDL